MGGGSTSSSRFLSTTILMVLQLLTQLTEFTSFNGGIIAVIAGSFLSYFATTAFYNFVGPTNQLYAAATHAFGDPVFWNALIAAVVLSAAPVLAYRAVLASRGFLPTATDLGRTPAGSSIVRLARPKSAKYQPGPGLLGEEHPSTDR
eukprot:gnl/Ergobibamus_cyprinoides/1232.p2 GENE.gnl/Ergobibamus_cyprinoides/1232~~gnl/Ergobibamus_cyprinoides/1232.p2  ORF type:complete len:147 (-),score=35.69 gnl/Ergobibamus_cyprinoides/1232:241-681(-)